MNRSFALLATLVGAALIFGSPADLHAVTKKKKKPVTADSDEATPAPKHRATPPLNLPLPAQASGAGPKDGTPAPKKKATDDDAADKAPAKTDKGTEKTAAETKAKPEHAPNATVEPETIAEFSAQPPRIQQMIRDALDLTRLNLTYTFGSADPDQGGMDCSGTIYYLLHAHSFADVPRDSSGQYLWARKSGAFFPVVSKSAESVEFKELQPGDLMFWTGTYETGRDVPISHVMLYLGREKGTGKRIMFGASDGRSYNGVPRWGVSVFDFKMPKADPANPQKTAVDFVGYARIPGLRSPAPPSLVAEQEPAEAVKKSAAETGKQEAATPRPKPHASKKSSTPTPKKRKKKSVE